MRRELAFEFARVTEIAAIAAYKWFGRGDKNTADGAAVEAMRSLLNTLDMRGEVVIGEGEVDEAPMLYIGEKIGANPEGDRVDIAVDPIDGTRMTAMGQGGAIAVLAAGEQGSLLQAPDMYMEKLVVGPQAAGAINLTCDIGENIQRVAEALGKSVKDITLATLAKPRHRQLIESVHKMGAKVFAIPDGDVAASVLTCMPQSEVDILYCIGGAPEGVLSAAAIRGLGGDMQARLLLRNAVRGESEENNRYSEEEAQRCTKMGVETHTVLKLTDLAKSDNIVFAATGISQGELLAGVKSFPQHMYTETLLIQGASQSVQKISTQHALTGKDKILAPYL